MSKDRDKWIEGIMCSMEGARKATPPADLFERISRRIDKPESKPVTTGQWRLAIAAAILLVLLNIAALQKAGSGNTKAENELPPIVAEFNLYQ